MAILISDERIEDMAQAAALAVESVEIAILNTNIVLALCDTRDVDDIKTHASRELDSMHRMKANLISIKGHLDARDMLWIMAPRDHDIIETLNKARRKISVIASDNAELAQELQSL